ncbi:MAG: PASTA domain-containing protein [Spirochaetales bacterium]|nr:PASTA domain-containing protein [Spirochaetales bacterium]
MQILEVLRNIFEKVGEFFRKILPNPDDNSSLRNFKNFVYIFIGFIIFTGFLAIVVFLAFVQTLDETVVPDFVGQNFQDSIVILQTKKLNPYINFEYTGITENKDIVFKQDPEKQEKVRIGRVVKLWVSLGARPDKIDNYIGRKLDDVKELISVRSGLSNLLEISNPVNFVTHSAPIGTIVAQYPPAGTEIGNRTVSLEFTVSKGLTGRSFTVGDYAGKSYDVVLNEISSSSMSFVFTVRADAKGEPGTIVAQNISSGTKVQPGKLLVLEMVPPNPVPAGMVFGVFAATIPDYGTPTPFKVELETAGKKIVLSDQERMGGKYSVPYIADENAYIIVTIGDEEKQPIRVKKFQ